MKKVLFATTALVASAGIASAQGVALTGSAEMGIVGGDGIETQFWHDIDVRFTLSGETDNGLTFGATIDLDEVGDDAGCLGIGATGGNAFLPPRLGGACVEEHSVFLSGNFGTITMGDTDGAFDWALQELDIIADIADANTTHAGFNGNSGLDGAYDGQVARYEYSFGDFAFAVSAELDDTGIGDPVFGIGGRYSGDLGGITLGVGVGYQTAGSMTAVDTFGPVFGDYDIVGLSLDAQFDNGIRAVLNYSALDAPAGWTGYNDHIGLGVFYSMDALSLGVNYGVYSSDFAGTADSEGVGLAANYDLGGGAVVQFGYSTGKTDDGTFTGTQTGSVDIFSLGIAMSF